MKKMLQVNELRIGNWIETNIKQQVTIEMLEFLINDKIEDKSVMKPIELSHEILLAAGFIHNDVVISSKKYYMLQGKNFSFIFVETEGLSVCFKECRLSATANFNLDCNFLHHLQNVYYFLEGNELNVEW